MSANRAAVSVDELQRAWEAVQDGEFRHATETRPSASMNNTWVPTEPVIVVAGATGRVGASAMALAIATASAAPTRVIECCSMHMTGFAAASTAELGVDECGWRQGTRGNVRVERASTPLGHPARVPMPSPTPTSLSVVDAGWDLDQLTTADTWVRGLLEVAPLVLVTVATIPGMRALESAMLLSRRQHDTWCAVVGPRRRRWPRPVQQAMSPAVTAADEAGRLVAVEEHRELAVNGITPEPLPPGLVAVGRHLFDQLVEDGERLRHVR